MGWCVNKYCFKCGVEDPNYSVSGYDRNCSECGGRACVLEVTEMLDLINDLNLKGLIPEGVLENVIDEDYSLEELDFDNDEDIKRAESDAFRDYLEDEY